MLRLLVLYSTLCILLEIALYKINIIIIIIDVYTPIDGDVVSDVVTDVVSDVVSGGADRPSAGEDVLKH